MQSFSNPKSWNRADILGALLIVALAAVVRLYDIGSQPLWLDEGYSWWDARQSLFSLWHLVPQCDPHPPFYALLLKGWSALFGDSSIAMRGFSTLLGVLATAMVLLAGREIDARVGWIAGILFALAPFQVEYGQEARPYTLVALGGALLLYGLLRCVQRLPAQSREVDRIGWIAIVAGAAISLWSNNTAVFTVAAAVVLMLLLFATDARTRVLAWPLFFAGLSAAALWAPYLPVYFQQAQGVSSDFWIPKPDTWRVLNELRFVIGLGSFRALWFLLPLCLVGFIVLWRRAQRSVALLVLGMFVVPATFNLIGSLLVSPVFLARALIGIAPAFTLALAAALAAVRWPTLRYSAIGVLAITRMVVVSNNLYTHEHRKEPWDEIAQAVVHEADANTLILMVPNELVLPLQHAVPDDQERRLSMRGVPADFPAPGMATARYPSGKCAPSVIGQNLHHIEQAVQGRSKIIFLTRRNNVYDPQDQIRALLKKMGLHEISMQRFMPGDLEMHEFELLKRVSAVVRK
jgi:uncharacterized membrane protein